MGRGNSTRGKNIFNSQKYLSDLKNTCIRGGPPLLLAGTSGTLSDILLLGAALQNIDKWSIYFTSFNSKFRFVVHKIGLQEATLSNANCFTDNFNFQYTEDLSRDTDRGQKEG